MAWLAELGCSITMALLAKALRVQGGDGTVHNVNAHTHMPSLVGNVMVQQRRASLLTCPALQAVIIAVRKQVELHGILDLNYLLQARW